MDTRVAREMIRVIKAERDTRRVRLAEEDPEFEHLAWLAEEPFISELCLAVLVAVYHQVEKEIVMLAARSTSDGRMLEAEEFRQNLEDERKLLKKNREKFVARLRLESLSDWHFIEILRFLVNSYKHNPSIEPDGGLLNVLHLDRTGDYLPLPESPTVKNELASSLGLQGDADYCEIAEAFLARVDHFLVEARTAQPALSKVALSRGSFDPKTALR